LATFTCDYGELHVWPTGGEHRSLLVELLLEFLVKSMAELKMTYVTSEQIVAGRLFPFKFTVS